MRFHTKAIAQMSVFVALAIIMGYIERLIPFDIGLQGVKLGLSNLVTLTALYTMGAPQGFCISILRVLAVSLLFGNFAALSFSLGGAILSFGVMLLLKKMNFFSVPIVSMVGGIFHNIGQLLVAALFMWDWRLSYYLPVLLVFGSISGFLVGLIASRIIIFIERTNLI